MKTLGSVASVAFLALSSATFVAGCGCEAGNNSVRTPVTYTPSSIAAVRTPSTCGVTNPQYTTTDNFALMLQGDSANMSLGFVASSAVNEASPLTVASTSDDTGAVTANSADGLIRFSFTPSADISTMDATVLNSVVITITSIPAADGQQVAAELYLTFEDGRVLDQVYTAPVSTTSVVCSH